MRLSANIDLVVNEDEIKKENQDKVHVCICVCICRYYRY